jgi:hypothetical protein
MGSGVPARLDAFALRGLNRLADERFVLLEDAKPLVAGGAGRDANGWFVHRLCDPSNRCSNSDGSRGDATLVDDTESSRVYLATKDRLPGRQQNAPLQVPAILPLADGGFKKKRPCHIGRGDAAKRSNARRVFCVARRCSRERNEPDT